MSPTTPRATGPSPDYTNNQVEAYIASAPEPSRVRLLELAHLIRAELPDATERIAYAIPTWHLVENVVHIAGYERHVGMYPGAAAMVAFAEDFAGYTTSKGAVQFPHDRALPLDLVRKVVRWRLDRVREKGVTTAGRRRSTPVTSYPLANPSAPTATRIDRGDLIDPGTIVFEATLHRSDASGAACFVDFPHDLKATFGRGNLVPVVATWDGRVEYRGSLAMMGGDRAMLLCRKDVLAQLGKGPGEAVQVSVALDTAARELEVPDALGNALDATDGAREAWDALSPSSRREYVQWIYDARRDATRDARVSKAIPMVIARKRLKG